jgi:outer membrane protein
MKKTFLAGVTLLLLIATVLPAHAFEVGIRGSYWFPSLDGDIRLDDGSLKGTRLDFEDDLGIDDEYYPFGEVFLGLGNHHLSFAFYRADYDGSNLLTKNINFGGKTYLAGDRIHSSLEYDVYDLTYRYDLLDLENILAGFSVGLVGRVMVFDLEAEIRSQTTAQSESEDYTVPVPLLGVNLHVGILADILEARILATAMGYWDGHMVDAQAELSFTPIPFVDIHGGYRMFFVDVDADDLELDYDTSGFYVGVTVSM